ncbi:ATP-binding protein [Mucilaginibacter sp.]|uniref:PAS domain-containing sensor histidine kinase n=1 Tax=Mucilaginibacter sp. TaxID=1882438 RepID=UPI00284DD471|nr:ATP-binding protein [Mucilaginibacter sp.]MDR3694430.1 ATP-binding protein [Mucilaginibacter sp.]
MITGSFPVAIFQTIFEKSPGSLLVQGDKPRFTIIAASDTYLEITSSIRENIVGKGFFEVFPDDATPNDDNSARKVFTKVVETGQKIDIPVYRFDVLNSNTKKYEVRYWSCCNTPIACGGNEVAYILNTVVDITREVKAKEAALENENRLRLAADAAALGTWELNIQSQAFSYSPRLAEIFGHPQDTSLSILDVRAQINRDDMGHIVIDAYFKALRTGKYLYEVRITRPDGSLRWIKVQGVLIYDERKMPLILLGTILDTTESKRDEIRKNDFIAMASHELKTPLTSIKAYLQLLSRKLTPSNDSFIDNALQIANLQVNRMTDLIHGFLDLSKLEPGKLKVDTQVFDLNKLIEEMIAESTLISPNHEISFIPGKDLTVAADREKIGQVMTNFLSNAIKYSNKGSKIMVSSKLKAGNVEVAVADEGFGINAKDQEKLFQRFYRVESLRMKNISGFGIGLYLASEIIQRHKGKIWVESAEDMGSTFYFSLPLHNK